MCGVCVMFVCTCVHWFLYCINAEVVTANKARVGLFMRFPVILTKMMISYLLYCSLPVFMLDNEDPLHPVYTAAYCQ